MLAQTCVGVSTRGAVRSLDSKQSKTTNQIHLIRVAICWFLIKGKEMNALSFQALNCNSLVRYDANYSLSSPYVGLLKSVSDICFYLM